MFLQGPANEFFEPPLSLVKTPDGVPTVTAPFLTSLHVQRVAYTNSQARWRTTGGLFQLFDNFGLLGARLLAPDLEQGGASYEVVGQVPAIAGQMSSAIGWNFKIV